MDRRVLIPQFASGTTGTYYLRALSRVAATARRDSTVNLGVALPGGVVDYRSPRSSNPRVIPSAEGDDIVTAQRGATRTLFQVSYWFDKSLRSYLIIQFVCNAQSHKNTKCVNTK